jgi:hypothetical protein
MPILIAKKFITVAIINKKKDNLYTVDRAEKINELFRKYPPDIYRFVDITGKGEIPYKNGAEGIGPNSQLTMDNNNDWKWKKTDEQIEIDIKERKILELRYLMVDLVIKKEKAETMGADYITVTTNLLALIIKTQKEIDDLIGI